MIPGAKDCHRHGFPAFFIVNILYKKFVPGVCAGALSQSAAGRRNIAPLSSGRANSVCAAACIRRASAALPKQNNAVSLRLIFDSAKHLATQKLAASRNRGHAHADLWAAVRRVRGSNGGNGQSAIAAPDAAQRGAMLAAMEECECPWWLSARRTAGYEGIAELTARSWTAASIFPMYEWHADSAVFAIDPRRPICFGT